MQLLQRNAKQPSRLRLNGLMGDYNPVKEYSSKLMVVRLGQTLSNQPLA
jgi:hypothetical protein